jgi:hypothetical protein
METSLKESRPRRTATEIKTLLRQQEHSKGTIKAFCRRKGLIEQTFYIWRKRYSTVLEKQEGFIPIQMSESASSIFAEIQWHEKIVIRLFQKVDAEYLKALSL